MLMTEPRQPSRKATPLEVARAVFWSFLGIRKLTPVQVIVAGIIGAVMFVLGLVMLVRFITS
jgi:hypothetical protein